MAAAASCSGSASSATASAASPCTTARVGTTTTWSPSCPHSAAAARATARTLPSLGSTSTSRAPDACTASSTSAVDGFAVGPPSTTDAPDAANSSARPGPGATATTARVAGRSFITGSAGSAAWSSNRVTVTRNGVPAATPASSAAPTSLTWTCTFHRSPSSSGRPTTTSESPREDSASRQRLDPRVVAVAQQELDLVGEGVAARLAGRGAGAAVAGDEGRRLGGDGLAGDDLLEGLEQDAQPASPGVDHPGVAQGLRAAAGCGRAPRRRRPGRSPPRPPGRPPGRRPRPRARR